MKHVEPRTIRPTESGEQHGYFIHWQNTDTHEEKWKEISKAEWDGLWDGERLPTMRQLQERFRALAARHGLESDPPRPHKPIMEELAEIWNNP